MRFFTKTCPVCGKPALTYDYSGVSCGACKVYNKPLTHFQHAVVWAKDRTGWWWRAAVVAVMTYWFAQYIHISDYGIHRLSNPFNALDFGIHELGHILFMPFGTFLTIAGGSIFQCLFPLLWLGVCIRKRWHFAASMVLVWFSYNLFDVATYAADARARLLPLATLSNDYDSAHDWYQILSRLDKLQYDTAIAHALRVAGTVCGAVGLLAGGALVLIMFLVWCKRFGNLRSSSS